MNDSADVVRYDVPLATALRLAENLGDYETSRKYLVLADLHGDFPADWMLQPEMAVEQCPNCLSEFVDHTDCTQHCQACGAHWPYNEPDRFFFPGLGGESA